MAIQIQLRNGSASLWTSANPVLAIGEVGLEIDTRLMKVGTGLDSWNTLKYQNASTASFCLSSSVSTTTTSASLAATASFSVSSSVTLTASYLNDGIVNSASYAISASQALSALQSISSSAASQSLSASYSFSASYAPGNPSVSSSYALSASNSTSSSYAITASYLNSTVLTSMSGSDFTTTTVSGTSTPLSFSMATKEIWTCEVYLTTQCSGAGGAKYAISSSSPSSVLDIEGWIMSSGNNITSAPIYQRVVSTNTLQSTATHNVANTPGPDKLHFSIINGSISNVISIAIASVTNGQTTTVFAGSYLNARRIGFTT